MKKYFREVDTALDELQLSCNWGRTGLPGAVTLTGARVNVKLVMMCISGRLAQLLMSCSCHVTGVGLVYLELS